MMSSLVRDVVSEAAGRLGHVAAVRRTTIRLRGRTTYGKTRFNRSGRGPRPAFFMTPVVARGTYVRA